MIICATLSWCNIGRNAKYCLLHVLHTRRLLKRYVSLVSVRILNIVDDRESHEGDASLHILFADVHSRGRCRIVQRPRASVAPSGAILLFVLNITAFNILFL